MTENALIVFSDLDGTLLDHHSYSYEAALPALSSLREHKIPLVLASSKTPAEMIPLRAELGFEDCPAIVENGAGVFAANDETMSASESYSRLIACLDNVPGELRQHFVGFSAMSIDQIIAETDLPADGAMRAKQRCYSEPGQWNGDDVQMARFLEHLSALGIVAKQGGRFLTLSFGGNKAERMAEIIKQAENKSGTKPISLALGDAPNDIEMLQTADHGVIIVNSDHTGIPTLSGERVGQITRSTTPGPAGWNEAVLDFVSRHIS